VALHPGSDPNRGLDKRLPVEKCAGVIRQLLARSDDVRVLIFIGPDEMDLLPRFRALRHPRVVLATGLKLPVIAGLIGKSKVLLAGDSGLGHIGAAVGVPVVSLFGPTYPQRIRPWGGSNVVLRADAPPPCMPCYDTPLYGKCPHGQKCLTAIEESTVVRAVCQILGCESDPSRDRLASPLHT
jgi:ADP-heptose:LPS heptosyltransferase